MHKITIKLGFLALLFSALTLAACGSDTPTATNLATTAVPLASTPPTTIATTVAAPTASTTTAAATTTVAPATTAAVAASKSLRGLRYCEVIPIYMQSGKLVQYVYNTQGFSDCPADQWNALNADDLAKSLSALKVTLNGPRYWMMDQVVASGDSASGEVKTFGELKMQLRAKIELPADSTTAGKSVPYAENIIERNTEYIFAAGKPTYQLVSPTGEVYVMQTYSQIIDPKLTIEDLSNLGSRLKLPAGWQYRIVTPDQDLHLVAKGQAYLIQDDLTNSYQKVTK